MLDSKPPRTAIRNGRLIDPANGVDGHYDLHLADGRVVAIGPAPDGFHADSNLDASGCLVLPGLVDLCARLREPGLTVKADIDSEVRAAAAAGVTTLVCPPDTRPVIDETAVVELIRRRAEASACARVLPLGALTRGLGGEQLATMAALKDAGCVGMSNALQPIRDTRVLCRALEYAASFDLTVFLSPLDAWLSVGDAHDGAVAARLGLSAMPVAAETAALARDLALIEEIGVRAHVGRLSSRRAVAMVARAQADGLALTADTAMHSVLLSETDIGRYDSCCHVVPPLRDSEDRDGLRDGLSSGVLTALCSDHQPHEADAKQGPFASTEPGISALDTLLPLAAVLVKQGLFDWPTMIARLSSGPADIIGRTDLGQLGLGASADVCIFDPRPSWRLAESDMRSRGRNSPFLGWQLQGQTRFTLLAGRLVYGSPPSDIADTRPGSHHASMT